MSSRAVYITAGIVVVVAVIVAIVAVHHSAGTSSPNNQPNNQNMAQATPTPSPTGTPSPSGAVSPTPTGATPTSGVSPTPSMTQAQISAAALQVQIPGCPNNSMADVKYDANGHFIPTLNIANKTVTLDTTMGNIKVELYDKDAPMAVENFECLVAKGYYNGITFHRVSHGFVIQAGDPTGTGSGGTSVYGSAFMDELYPDTASYKAGYLTGVLAMANSGPNTNGSQFFIMLADHPELPHAYTIFGKVTVGLDVVNKIGLSPVTPSAMGQEDGAPVTPIVITKATLN